MSKNYLDNFYSFVAKAQSQDWIVKGPEHLPDDIAPDNKLYLSRIALEAKFNRKFTEDEVIELLQELPKKKKSKDDVEIPQWYIDKWLTKSDSTRS